MKSWWIESQSHLRLAWPLCLGHVGQQLMTLVDSIMLGHYDKVALGGFGIASTLLFSFTFIGVGIILGLDSLIPQALGRDDEKEARALFRSGLHLAARVGIPLTAMAGASTVVLDLAGVEPAVAAEARIYLWGRLPSLVPYLFFVANSSYLQAVGHTRPIVLAVVIGNLINFVTDALLVFGDGALEQVGLPALGLPALGALGASLSTCMVVLVMTLFVALATRALPVPGAEGASAERTAKIFRIGFPVGCQLLAEVGIFAIAGVLAGRLGAVPAGAHQLALTLASVTFSVAIGMSAATSVRVGRAIGAADHQGARRAGWIGLFWAALIMGIAGVFFLLTPRPLARIFTDDLDIIAASVPLLAIAALFQLSDASQAVLAGALRGAGDTRATFLGNLIGHYGVGIWLMLALGVWGGYGATGLWWGLSGGLTVTAMGLAARFWWLSSRPFAMA